MEKPYHAHGRIAKRCVYRCAKNVLGNSIEHTDDFDVKTAKQTSSIHDLPVRAFDGLIGKQMSSLKGICSEKHL